jgi:glyoxylase-like metal-dependent hydrolase (beta-lactamase superfamily II)
MNPRITRHPDGICAVDTEYLHPGHAAAHVIQHNGRSAVVDPGPNSSVPHLLAAFESFGIAREAVDYVFLTHVHLDHAGGAGLLMRKLPNARLVVHPRGAPHMIDPAKLIAGSTVVYGEERFRHLYGDILPIAQERVIVAPDGYKCELAGRRFELIHTPGHALHHLAIIDPAHSSIFSGDTFGVSYRELDTEQGAFILPTTSPSQFDPDQLIASIDRLVAYSPRNVYLMHYSRVTGVPRLAEMLKGQIREFVRIARVHENSPDAHGLIGTAMFELWLQLLQRQGSTLSGAEVARLLKNDLDLNAQGLIVWLEREKKGRGD